MANFILIAFCILAGILFRKRQLVPADGHKSINAWIINIALPAVSFKYLTHITWAPNLLIPALGPILVFFGGLVFIHIVARHLKSDKSTYGALQLTAGLSNTSFVGFPLIMAYYSEKEISIAIISDQVTFLLFSIFGIIIAVKSSSNKTLSFQEVLKKVVTFPPLIGCVAALLIPRDADLSAIEPVFQMLASTIAPLALFSIGLQLSFVGWRQELKPIAIILCYKLILAPLLVLTVLILFGIKGITPKIAVFEAAMPVLLSVGILTDRYAVNPKLANLIIGVSIVASFITTGIWWFVIEYFIS